VSGMFGWRRRSGSLAMSRVCVGHLVVFVVHLALTLQVPTRIVDARQGPRSDLADTP
jgi:hypothetical protein